MQLSLPETPTFEQVNAVRLAIVREAFESDATNYRSLEPPEGIRWKGVYTVGEQDFNIEYDGTEFTKWPVGGGQDD